MSDINYSVAVRVAKGRLNNSINVSGATAEMNETGLLSQTLTLSTSTISISTANLSSAGLAFIQNLATNTLATAAFGVNEAGTFVEFCNLRAGEPAVLRLVAGKEYQAKGASGSLVRVDITEG